MSLTFPTGLPVKGIAPKPGIPDRAVPCHCDGGPCVLIGEERCWRCGHDPSEVIAESWADRARKVARLRAKAAA